MPLILISHLPPGYEQQRPHAIGNFQLSFPAGRSVATLMPSSVNTDPSMLPSSLSHNPALSLPSPSVQNQIHELAKTLPPPRKQNIACDACRYAIIYLLTSFAFHHLMVSTPTRQAEESQVPSAVWTAESMSSPSFPLHVLD